MTSQKEINRVGPSFFPTSGCPPSSNNQVRQFQHFPCPSASASCGQSSGASFGCHTLPQRSNTQLASAGTQRDWINEDGALGAQEGDNIVVNRHHGHHRSGRRKFSVMIAIFWTPSVRMMGSSLVHMPTPPSLFRYWWYRCWRCCYTGSYSEEAGGGERRKRRRNGSRRDCPARIPSFTNWRKYSRKRGLSRGSSEPMSGWLERAGRDPGLKPLHGPLQDVLRLHYRHPSFDPRGLQGADRVELRDRAKSCLAALGRLAPVESSVTAVSVSIVADGKKRR